MYVRRLPIAVSPNEIFMASKPALSLVSMVCSGGDSVFKVLLSRALRAVLFDASSLLAVLLPTSVLLAWVALLKLDKTLLKMNFQKHVVFVRGRI